MPIKNFDIPFKNIDGTEASENGASLAMRTVLVNACMMSFPNENLTDGEEKAKRFALGMKINKDGDIDLQPEEIVLLKRLVGYGWPPLLVGQIYEILNS